MNELTVIRRVCNLQQVVNAEMDGGDVHTGGAVLKRYMDIFVLLLLKRLTDGHF